MSTFSRKGFTLIELLIVVAIIAILAAIAVPNFLEAQTRAKISRAKSDLRTVSTALESYVVDENTYPTMIEMDFDGGVKPWLEGSQLKWWYIPNSLSTPIAYVSNAHLTCPFGGDIARQGDFPDDIWRRYSYENVKELAAKVNDFPALNGKYGVAARPKEKIGLWRVLCIGPNAAWNPMAQYDASNGTKSDGNIMRTQRNPEGGAFL